MGFVCVSLPVIFGCHSSALWSLSWSNSRPRVANGAMRSNSTATGPRSSRTPTASASTPRTASTGRPSTSRSPTRRRRLKRKASSLRVGQSTNEAGLSDFHALRLAITRRPQDLYLVAFDLLHLNGHDLRDMRLKDRREILQAVIPTGGHIQFSEALPGIGEAVYHLACEAGLEGIVSKRLDSVYRSGGTMNWRKIKCYVEKEMDIIGVKRETGKPPMVLMAEQGRYMGGAFITSKPISGRLFGTVYRARSALLRQRLGEGKSRMAQAGARRSRQVPQGRGQASARIAYGFPGSYLRAASLARRTSQGLSWFKR